MIFKIFYIFYNISKKYAFYEIDTKSLLLLDTIFKSYKNTTGYLGRSFYEFEKK